MQAGLDVISLIRCLELDFAQEIFAHPAPIVKIVQLSAVQFIIYMFIFAPTFVFLAGRPECLLDLICRAYVTHIKEFSTIKESFKSSLPEIIWQTGLDVISLICRAYVTLIEENCGPRAVVPRMPDLNFELRREKVCVGAFSESQFEG